MLKIIIIHKNCNPIKVNVTNSIVPPNPLAKWQLETISPTLFSSITLTHLEKKISRQRFYNT